RGRAKPGSSGLPAREAEVPDQRSEGSAEYDERRRPYEVRSPGRAVLAGCLALLGACHGAPPATTALARSAPAATCKVSEPVCDPAVSDDTALALVRRRCAGCHAEGGKAQHPLLELSVLGKARSDVALRLSGCEM